MAVKIYLRLTVLFLSLLGATDVSESCSSSVPLPEDKDSVEFARTVGLKEHANDLPMEVLRSFHSRIGTTKMAVILDQGRACHSQGHNFGRLVYELQKDLGAAMSRCGQVCSYGCFHGVMMAHGETVRSQAPKFEKLKAETQSLCRELKIGEGACLHGVGHAVTVANQHSIKLSLDFCDAETSKEARDGCASGVYMERDAVFGDRDARAGDPCQQESRYRSHCYRFHLKRAYRRAGKDPAAAVSLCVGLADRDVSGCMGAIGYAWSKDVMEGEKNLAEVCAAVGSKERNSCLSGFFQTFFRMHGSAVDSHHRLELRADVCSSKDVVFRRECERLLKEHRDRQ